MPRLVALPLIAVVACAGCAVARAGSAEPATYDELRRQEGWILLDEMRHVPQSSEQDSGAAALSMVLARWGVDVPVATLWNECAIAGDEGLRALALRDAARRRGFSAYVIEGRVADLEHELQRGRPVLVGLVKTVGPISTAHYEVVVGIRPEHEVASMDPARGLVRDALPAFAREWAAASGVTLVVYRPESKPVPGSTGP